MAELLNAERAAQARPYDFAEPRLLSEKQRQSLQEALELQSRVLSRTWSRSLDLECQVAVAEIAEVATHGWLTVTENPLYEFDGLEAEAPVLCSPDATLAQLLVERLLGGNGAGRAVDREVTDIESALVSRGIDSMQALWQVGESAEAKPAVYVPSTTFARREPRRGIGIAYSVQCGETSLACRVFASYEDVTRVSEVSIGRHAASHEERPVITTENLRHAPFRLRAQIPPIPIRLRDLRQLQVGDVVRLERKATDEVQVAVGNKVLFVGHPGTHEGNVGIRISRAVRT